MTRHELAGIGLVLLWALVWAAALLGARIEYAWLQIGSAIALIVGSVLILAALAGADRLVLGRRPAGADPRRPEASVFPPRADVAHGSTAPRSAGRRALSSKTPAR